MRRSPLRSPPRMRGKVNLLLDGNIPLGITPAYAGKRKSPPDATWHTGDHPRVCGEKEMELPYHKSAWGSPPRMRGKDHGKPAGHGPLGITPACAGKSSQRSSATRSARDHPRVCGEKTFDRLLEMAEKGSPPRVWGKDVHVHAVERVEGITPACAGKERLLPEKHTSSGITPAYAGKSYIAVP